MQTSGDQDLWRILFLSPHLGMNTIETFEGNQPEDGAGHAQAGWKALAGKCTAHTKEARGMCHGKTVNTKMNSGQDSDDYVFIPCQRRHSHEKIGQTAHTARGARASFFRLFLANTRSGAFVWTRSGHLLRYKYQL